MSDAILDLIVRAQAQGTAALAAMSKELGGMGGASSQAAKDGEKLATEDGKGGVLGGMASSLAGMINPLTIATAGIGAMALVGDKAFETYQQDEVSIKALDTALTNHGLNVGTVTAAIEANKASYEALGYTVEDVRPVFTQLTEAGLTQAQQMTAMQPIMDLARAKNIDLSSAATMYAQAMEGSGKALKAYGILLPTVSASSADVGKATDKVTAAHLALTNAETNLTVVEDSLRGKHTLTAAEAQKLQLAHEKVTTASDNLKTAQQALTLAQQGGVDKGARLALVNADLEKAIGGQASSITETQQAQAQLSDDWDTFSEAVGPAVETALDDLLKGLVAVFGFIGNTAVPAVETLLGDLGKVVGAVSGAVGAISHIPGVGLIGSAIGTLTGHATGGRVPGMPGSPQLILAHGGETVGTPGGPTGGGASPIHMNVTIAGGIVDPNGTFAQQLADSLSYAMRRSLNRSGMSLA